MRPWLCSCWDARRIASFHNISRSTFPSATNAGTALKYYRASGLVLRGIAVVGGVKINGSKQIQL
jgi:hypothetical protein